MSSLIFLGFSTIAFLLSYGILWMVMPIIFGIFFGVLDNVIIPNPKWAAVYDKNQELVRFLTPLAATLGVFIFIIKVGMVASARGRD